MTRVLAVMLGLLWAVFVAFNAVFSDVFGWRGQAEAFAYVFFAYAGLALAFGILGPATGTRWALWLAPWGMLAVVAGFIDEPGRPVFSLLVFLAIAIGSLAGAWLGTRLGRALVRGRDPDGSRRGDGGRGKGKGPAEG
jgi:hypothetical protein